MKESNILISILVPTYNRVKYLQECLDSIIEQEGFDLKELELIVSDNSEGEETKNFMEKYINDNKNWNIQYNKNKKNLGMVGNWNKLLELKKGEYFIFLSDDDKFYDKNSLKNIYDGLIKYKLDACYGKYRIIDSEGNDQGDFQGHNKIGNKMIYYDTFNEQIQGHSISFGGILYKDFGFKYNENVNVLGDYMFNLEYLSNDKKIGLINIYSLYYRLHSNNVSKFSGILDIYQERLNVFKHFNVKHYFLKNLFFTILEFICSLKIYKYIYKSKKGSLIIAGVKKAFGLYH